MNETTSNVPTDHAKSDSTLGLTAQIVAAYVSKNSTPGAELPALIDQIYQSLAGVATGSKTSPDAGPTPAVPVKKSVFPDYIVCLEDGKKLKMLKRHLMTSYNLTPDAYRERWGLPSSYPMVAPSYAERRSALAKSIGLGRKPATAAAVAAEPKEEQVTPLPKSRGRRKAAESNEG